MDSEKRLINLQEEMARRQTAGLSSGGGGGTYDPMEARVKALEDKFEKIDGKLDKLVEGIGEMRLELKGKSDKEDVQTVEKELSYLKGKVDQLPTILQLVMFTIAIFTAAGVLKYFGH